MTEEGAPGSAAAAPLSTPAWLWRTEALTGTSFLAMLRRLPALLARAGRLGWQASPRDTALAVILGEHCGQYVRRRRALGEQCASTQPVRRVRFVLRGDRADILSGSTDEVVAGLVSKIKELGLL